LKGKMMAGMKAQNGAEPLPRDRGDARGDAH
jgi:hypothetical protein